MPGACVGVAPAGAEPRGRPRFWCSIRGGMSALEILMLVGFASGAALHFYITWLIARREDLWGPEPAFVALGTTLGVWHFGSLLAALFRVLGIADGHVLLRLSDTLVFASLSFLPATLAHAHVAFLGWRDGNSRI